MCQSKVDGGKRCAIHMFGSRAVLRVAKALGAKQVAKTAPAVRPEVVEAVAKEAFKDLRREGKNLPAPSPEMVKAFADQQRFSTHFNPDLDEHERKIAERAWGRAAEDAPDGGTFHAWKHTVGETMHRMRARATAVAASSVLSFSLAACSGGGLANEPAPNLPEPSSSPSVSAPAVPGGDAEVSNDNWGVAISDNQVTDAYGTYNQIEVQADSPLMQYDESVATDAAKSAYSAEDIRSAQQTVSDFYVSEGVDSRLVFDNSQAARDQWLSDNTGKFAEPYQADLYATVQNSTTQSGYGVVEGNSGNWREANGLKPYEYSSGNARVVFEDVKISNIDTTPAGDLRFDYEAQYVRRVVDAEGTVRMERTVTTQSYSVAKDASGGWKLTGWQNQFNNDWTQLAETK